MKNNNNNGSSERSRNKTILWVILFAIAMGLFESAVVVYLRELYYRTGFEFPLKTIPAAIARVEMFREVATIIMLVACGVLAGNSKLQRFAFFVLAFAVWDLFYYLFLYIFIHWPQSLHTWDILFLIPVPWVGPVWAPCLLCLIMIAGSLYIIFKTGRDRSFKIQAAYWFMMITGSVICIVAFMWDYLNMRSSKTAAWNPFSNEDLFRELETYVPEDFNTGLFFTGFLFMSASLILSAYKNRTANKPAQI